MTESSSIQSLLQQLMQAPRSLFPVVGKLDITCDKGVYVIYDPANEVAHVGNTPRGEKGLCGRLNNHISRTSSFAREYLMPRGLTVSNGYSFNYLVVESARERALLEALAIGMLCPKHIGTGERKVAAI